VVTVVFVTPGGRLSVMAEPLKDGTTLVLQGLHIHGDHGVLPNTVGAANLRAIADVVMERMGFDGIVAEGAIRTTGANPHHRPAAIRFTRRIRSEATR
jgi:hypothetical protein